MGVGGLLTEIPTRPQPRDERPAELPRIGAVVLAAGLSSRMGSHKLLEEVGGQTLVRRSVEAALASAAGPGHCCHRQPRGRDRGGARGPEGQFVDNPDFPKGLSTSLKRGINALPDDCDGALVLLADNAGRPRRP